MEEQENIICPWCLTEIIWDEEIGPERHCPHCENELTGYRTLQLDMESDEEGDGKEIKHQPQDEDDWNEEPSNDRIAAEDDLSEYIQYSREDLAFEETVERIIDEQQEAPECPSCREYMLEAGVQTIASSSFEPSTPSVLSAPILPAPFQVVWYVCPSCFRAENKLAAPDQERLVQLLTEAADSKAD
ncbi:hypothetical protein PAECIP111893_04954 [Paenibacillus plantiphilus]|uniref:Uncharacterized protein n=1 Tax=Paenibacillus plantiphilus TaxID=2905650 RepID=A0ABM9CSR0_9BACL|nr:hypothetical protein [Paenibacillus plantiphilus]CAH1223321.1 hypothetical protein PAECIP111893_04954 [Paenibacillus plantiphilus]